MIKALALLTMLISAANAQVARQNGQASVAPAGTVTTNYTATAADKMIFANCSAVGGCTITLPAANTSNGQAITITKVDTSSQPVIVKAAGTDLIASTQSVTMYARSQILSVTNDGATNWWTTKSLPFPSTILNYSGEPNAAAAPAAANSCHWCPFQVFEPIWISSFTYDVGATGSGNIQIGVADQFHKVLFKTDGNTIPGTGIQISSVTTGLPLNRGTYYVGICLTSVTTTLTRFGTGGSNLSCYVETPQAVVPSTATFRPGAGVRQYAITINGVGSGVDIP